MAATAQLIVRLEPDEKQRVADEAQQSKRTISDYVRSRLFGDDATAEDKALVQFLVDIRPRVRKAMKSIDGDLAAIAALRKQAAEASAIAQRTRAALDSEALDAIVERLDLTPAPAARRARAR